MVLRANIMQSINTLSVAPQREHGFAMETVLSSVTILHSLGKCL